MIRSAIVAARPSGYHASAVQFDGTTWAKIAALAASADNGKATVSIWLKATQLPDDQNIWNGGADAYNYFFIYGSGSTPADTFEASFGDAVSETYADWGANPSYTVWRNIIQSCDISGATPHFASYQSDVRVGAPFSHSGAFPTSLAFNGNGFAICNDLVGFAHPANCSMADFQLWNRVSIVETDDTILTANRRFLINAAGKPVNPTVAQTAFGTPTLRLNGNAATWTSLLIGYGFTITGVLTNASTSPSD